MCVTLHLTFECVGITTNRNASYHSKKRYRAWVVKKVFVFTVSCLRSGSERVLRGYIMVVFMFLAETVLKLKLSMLFQTCNALRTPRRRYAVNS